MKKLARKKITAALLCAALSWQGCVYAQQNDNYEVKNEVYQAVEGMVKKINDGSLEIMPLYAAGNGANASGSWSTAVGQDASASGGWSTAVGQDASASGDWSTAVGQDASASGGWSTAVGEGASASGDWSTAVGEGASASGDLSTAVGEGASASYNSSAAIGQNSRVSAANTVSFGRMNSSYDSNYRNLEGIEDVYVNGGIIFTNSGAVTAANLQQGELRGVTKINGVQFSSDDNTYSIGNIVFGADGTNVQSINGIRFGVDSGNNAYSIGNIVFDTNGQVTSINDTDFSKLVNTDLSGITDNISKLQDKVNSINSDISGINGDITTINDAIDGIKDDISDLENSSGNVDGEDIKPGSVTTDKVTVGDADSGTQTVIDGSSTVMTKNEGGFSNTTTMDGSSTVMTKTNGSSTSTTTTQAGSTIMTKTEGNTTSTTTTEAGSIKVSSETTGTDGSKETSSVSIADGDIELSKTGADGKQQTIKVGEEISSIRGDMDSMRSDINAMGRSIDRLGEEIDEVGALSAALAGLHPNPINANSRADFAMAVGSYDGESAIAAGAFYRPDKRTMLSLGASATSGNQMFNMGVTFALDKLPEKENKNSEVLQAVLARLDKLEAENAELKAQVAAQKEADNA